MEIDNAQAAEEAFDNTEKLVLALAALNSHVAFCYVLIPFTMTDALHPDAVLPANVPAITKS